MKTVVWIAGLMIAFLGAPTRAATLTTCTGSWDGPGLTACELLGEPGEIYSTTPDLSPYGVEFTLLVEITALSEGNLLLRGEELDYWTGTRWLNSSSTPEQFAYWMPEGGGLIVGVEDLTSPSDWDYNDYLVRFEPRAVPEPLTVGMVLLGVGGVIRRQWKE